MGADPYPEIATNDEWRGIMRRRRKDLKLTQAELGGRVGTSQNIVSMIESGEVSSSKFIVPICRFLKIPVPQNFDSDEQKVWSELGHVLRNKNMKQYRRALALIEAMVEDDAETKPANDESEAAPKRK